jgi:hypothetical protein
MHPPEALIAFGAGPSSGPAEAVEKYLPTLRPGSAARPPSVVRIGTVDDGPESSHLRLLCSEPFATATKAKRRTATRLLADGQALGFDQGRMYLSFSPFTQLVATNDFAVLFLFTPRSTMRRTWICTGWWTAKRPRWTWKK